MPRHRCAAGRFPDLQPGHFTFRELTREVSMKTYCIRYRLGPSVEETKDLLVEAPDSRTAAEKAARVLGLRYPHHVVMGHLPGAELRQRPAGDVPARGGPQVSAMAALRGLARGLYGDRDDLREFRRLRDFYRRNFINGASDECFVIWVEDMCAQEAADSMARLVQGGRPSAARLSSMRALNVK